MLFTFQTTKAFAYSTEAILEINLPSKMVLLASVRRINEIGIETVVRIENTKGNSAFDVFHL